VLGRADAIFCRNVLIYLDAHARRRVIDMFHERLYPGGALLLGHSESLLNVTTAFELLHLREDLAYRKPLGQYKEGQERTSERTLRIAADASKFGGAGSSKPTSGKLPE